MSLLLGFRHITVSLTWHGSVLIPSILAFHREAFLTESFFELCYTFLLLRPKGLHRLQGRQLFSRVVQVGGPVDLLRTAVARRNWLKLHPLAALARNLWCTLDIAPLQVVRCMKVEWIRHLLDGKISREGHLVGLHALRIRRALAIKGTIAVLTVSQTRHLLHWHNFVDLCNAAMVLLILIAVDFSWLQSHTLVVRVAAAAR